MKKTMKKILALVLTMLMLLSVAAPVFANTAATVECPAEHTKESLDALGIKYTEISKHTAEFCEDRSYTTYRCDSCKTYFLDDIVLPAAGVKCEWEVTTVATCAVEGVKTCKVCKYEMKTGKNTDPNAHEWEYELPCGNVGQKTNRTCKICGIVEKDVLVKDTHNWNKIEVIEEPTCGVNGKAVYTCTICEVTKTLEITADAYNAGHNWVYGKAQTMDCSKKLDGINAGYYCKDCNIPAEMNQEIKIADKTYTNTSIYKVTPYYHDEVRQTLVKLSCTEDGSTLIKCNNCSYYELVTEEALGHEWERPGNDRLDYSKLDKTLVPCDATTETAGKYVFSEYCNECKEDITIYEEEHTIVKNKYVAPTCMKFGYTCDYCEICNVEFNVKVDDTTPKDPDNHSWCGPNDIERVAHPDWYEVTTPATCTKPGVATSVCKLCGGEKNENVVVPAKHHDYYDIDPITGQIVTDADGKAVLLRPYYDCSIGAIVYTCTVCEKKSIEDREANWTYIEKIEGFDYNDPAWHTYCGGNFTKVAGDARNHDGDCENDKVTVYQCDKHALYFVHNEGKQHAIRNAFYEPAIEPTCDTKGQVGYEQCDKCNYKKGIPSFAGGILDELGHDWDMTTYVEAVEPTCTTEGSLGYGVCLRENCNKVVGEKSESKRVIPALGHPTMIDTVIVKDATCTTYAFTVSACADCDLELWVDYRQATGHELDYADPAHEPTCTAKGKLTCTNPDCGLGLGVVYTEEVNKIPHVDMEGNDIKCVTEDFYCFECCNPEIVSGKFTGKYGTDPIAAIESHYYADTVLRGAADCTGYTYYLHVCTECDTTWVDPNEPMIPNDHNRVPGKVLTEATYLTPGVREINCTKCNTVVGTEEYTLGVQFSFEFDNALVPGAAIVNSGYLAVKVYTNAYKQMVHSVDFTFYADSALFTLDKVVVEDQNSPFYGMFFAGQTGSFVNVYGTVANDANGKTQNVELNGADQYLVTLIFKVADDANSAFATTETVTGFFGFDGASEVNALDESVINSAFAGYHVAGLGTVLGPVDDNKTPNDATDDKYFELTIKILGDVNGDATKTNGAVASAVDVNKIRDLIAKGEYLAQADMDKDGAITVADFEYLAVYHVGGMTYAELCMLPEVPQAPVVTPSCPCCP